MKYKMPAIIKGMLVAISSILVVIAGLVGSYKTAPPADLSFGALSGPDISSPYLSFGGVRNWAARDTDLSTATTTICALQSPIVESKLLVAGLKLTTSTTTASLVTFARAATAFATTSSLGTATLGANQTGTFWATTTSNDVFPASSFLVIGMQGGGNNYTSNSGGAAYSPVGACQATWQAI